MGARTLATMFAGPSDMTWNTPNVSSRVTCDTMVEINETPAYLITFTLDGWAIIWRSRAVSAWSEAQMCLRGGWPPWFFMGAGLGLGDATGGFGTVQP